MQAKQLIRWLRVVPIAAAMALPQAAAAQDAQYRARLSTVPISAAERETITGRGSASASLDGRELTITGSFEGLQGAATTAHLHLSPVTGVRGPAILELTVGGGVAGSLSGTVELNRSQAQALRDGRIYIQIASDAAPDGNLWGWLLE